MTGMGRLRSLRRRVERAVASADELGRLRAELAEVRGELAAVRAAYARDGQLFVAHRAAWERERARLVTGLPGPLVGDQRYGDFVALPDRTVQDIQSFRERRAR